MLKREPRLSKSMWSNGGQKKRPQAKRSGGGRKPKVVEPLPTEEAKLIPPTRTVAS